MSRFYNARIRGYMPEAMYETCKQDMKDHFRQNNKFGPLSKIEFADIFICDLCVLSTEKYLSHCKNQRNDLKCRRMFFASFLLTACESLEILGQGLLKNVISPCIIKTSLTGEVLRI